MATSINSPSLGNAIRTDVPAINTILKALAKADPSALSDIENGTKRITQDSNTKVWSIQERQGNSWVVLKSFDIDAKSVDGKTLSTGVTPNTIAVRDANGKLAGDILGNAATATSAVSAGTLSTALLVSKGGTGATSVAAARTSLGVPPTSHASTGTSYGMGTDANYGHVKLSDSTNSTSAATAGIAASPKAVKAAYDLAASKVATKNGTNTYELDSYNVDIRRAGSTGSYYLSVAVTNKSNNASTYNTIVSSAGKFMPTMVKNVTLSGTTITVTKGDDTTSKLVIPVEPTKITYW